MVLSPHDCLVAISAALASSTEIRFLDLVGCRCAPQPHSIDNYHRIVMALALHSAVAASRSITGDLSDLSQLVALEQLFLDSTRAQTPT